MHKTAIVITLVALLAPRFASATPPAGVPANAVIFTGFPTPAYVLSTSVYGAGGARTDSLYPFGANLRSLNTNLEGQWFQDPSEYLSTPDTPAPCDQMDNDTLKYVSYPYPDGISYYGYKKYWISGQQNTASEFNFQYGYVEAYVQQSPGQGMWNAAWVFNSTTKGELDMFEQISGKNATSKGTYYATLHSSHAAANQYVYTGTADLTAGFHTYGVYWTPTTVTFYLDGTAIKSMDVTGQTDFQVPMFLISNLAIGGTGSWPGAPDGTTAFPATQYVKYFRVYSTPDTINVTGADAVNIPWSAPAVGTAQLYCKGQYYTTGYPAVTGMKAELCDSNKTAIASINTDSTGGATFKNIAAGTYYIHYVYPVGWAPRSGTAVDNYGFTGAETLTAGQHLNGTYLQLVSHAP